MADNLNVTAGSGTTIATDDVSGVHFQKVKLIESTAESTTATGVSGNPLRVDPTGSTAQPVTDNGSSLTIDGTVAVSGTVAVTDNSSTLSVDDGGSTLTIDGTVTANLSATDNTVLDSIDTSTQGILSDTASIQTAVETLDDVVKAEDAAHQSGDKGVMTLAVRQDTQADFGADGDYVPLSVDADGKLRVAASVNAEVTIGSEYDEDAAHSTGDTGSFVLAVRQDTATALAGADGDYAPLEVDANGRLHTLDQNSAAIKTAVETLDNAISGSEMQVDVVTMPTVAVTQSGTWDEVGINDSGNSITVDGTVTANLGATDNAVLDDIAADTEAIKTAVEGTLTVTGGGGGVEYTEGDTDASITGSAAMMEVGSDTLQPIQGTVAGGLLVNLGSNNDVTVTGTVDLGATDNAVLDAIAASVADVDTNTDGIEALLTTIDGDTSNLSVVGSGTEATAQRVTIATDSTGVLSVDDNGGALTVDGTVAVTGVATEAKQDTQVTHLATIAGDTTDIETAVELIDDTVATLGTTTYTEAATKGLIIGAVRRDADTTLVDTTNEVTPLQVDASGRLKVEAFSGETLPVSLTSTTVTGTVAVTQSGTWDEVGINDSGNSITVDYATTGSGTATGALRVELPTNGTGVIATVGAVTAITNALPAGTNAIGKLAANSGVDIGDVDVTSSALPTGASTLAEQQSQTTALQLIDDSVFADDADWTADTSKHVLVGGVTQATPSANTDGDVTPLITNALRELRVAVPESDLATAATTHVKKYYTNAGAVTDGIVWSPAAGKRWFVTDLIINVSAAATVTLEDDLAGGDSPVMKFELAANSGIAHSFTTPWFSGEDAADLIVTTSAGNVYITVTGYEI